MLLDLQANITLDNYGEVLTSLSGAVRGAAINEQIQNTNDLAKVAATFERSAALINEMTIVPNTVSSLARNYHDCSLCNNALLPFFPCPIPSDSAEPGRNIGGPATMG